MGVAGRAPQRAGTGWRARVDRTPLTDAVRIGFERTLEQDPGLGMRQLCDPACKALSPAVNDPYTAIQAIEHLTVLYVALAANRPGDCRPRRRGAMSGSLPVRSPNTWRWASD